MDRSVFINFLLSFNLKNCIPLGKRGFHITSQPQIVVQQCERACSFGAEVLLNDEVKIMHWSVLACDICRGRKTCHQITYLLVNAGVMSAPISRVGSGNLCQLLWMQLAGVKASTNLHFKLWKRKKWRKLPTICTASWQCVSHIRKSSLQHWCVVTLWAVIVASGNLRC